MGILQTMRQVAGLLSEGAYTTGLRSVLRHIESSLIT